MKSNSSLKTDKKKKSVSELFRATLGFDFIFSYLNGCKTPLCIEINGDDSGLMAVESIPMGDITEDERGRVRTRMIHTEERLALSAYAESLDPVSQSEARKEAWAKARSVPGFVHAFRNPPFIREIASKDKRLQQDFIPPANRPRFFRDGESPLSSTGFWICKPISGRKGKGIKILSNEEFASSFLENHLRDGYIAQELIKASGADRALSDMKENPAALRLLIDFIYFEDNSIEEVFAFAYQRVSPLSVKEQSATSFKEKLHVVNFATGAKAAAASESEFKAAHKVALKVIDNIAKQIAEVK